MQQYNFSSVRSRFSINVLIVELVAAATMDLEYGSAALLVAVSFLVLVSAKIFMCLLDPHWPATVRTFWR